MFYSQFSRKPVVFNGSFAVGARVAFFDAGSNTVRTMYSDGLLTTELDPTNIRTDANGVFPAIFGQGGAYKAVVYEPGSTAILYTEDNIPGDVTTGGGGGGGGGTDLATGDVVPSILSGTRTGFVRANGKTIGNGASGASERADDDCEALFLAMWSNTLFSVSGGRGASAAADWAANKQITLPNGLARAMVGVDGMGGTATNLFNGLTFTTGTASAVGSTIGAATQALTIAQLAAHTHSGTTDTAAAHQHTGATGFSGGHFHGGGTSFDGAHSHTVNVPANNTVIGTNTPVTFNFGGPATVSTDAAGTHNHSITTSSVPDHNHLFTSDAGGAHSHTITASSTGSGEAHPNVQPSLLVTYYVKL